MDYIWKEVVKLGLDYAKKRFIDVSIENKGRSAFAINKCLKVTKAFTAVTDFNPEVLAKMDIDEIHFLFTITY